MIVHQPLQCIIDFVLSNRESPAVAVFLATLPNLKLLYLSTTLSIICVCLKMSISLSISHAALMFWIKIGFLSTSLESHNKRILLYCVCHNQLSKHCRQPSEALANFGNVGPVPEELQGLTWIEELLIARVHVCGSIVRLGQ